MLRWTFVSVRGGWIVDEQLPSPGGPVTNLLAVIGHERAVLIRIRNRCDVTERSRDHLHWTARSESRLRQVRMSNFSRNKSEVVRRNRDQIAFFLFSPPPP